MEERILITSHSNQLVKKVRALKGRKARTEYGLFLVEGLHQVGSALEAGWDVDAILYAPDFLSGDFAISLLDNARQVELTVQPVSATVMNSLAEKENPQGILAMVRQRDLSFNELQDTRSGIALVSPQDPGNVGAILRTIDAVGADSLFLLNPGKGSRSSVDLYHPTCVRASMGTLFWKQVVRVGFDEFIDWAKGEAIQLIGTSAHGSVDYQEIKPVNTPWLLVLGSEQKGLSEQQLSACNQIVSLPMRGKVSSLNLSVAAGVLLYGLNS